MCDPWTTVAAAGTSCRAAEGRGALGSTGLQAGTSSEPQGPAQFSSVRSTGVRCWATEQGGEVGGVSQSQSWARAVCCLPPAAGGQQLTCCPVFTQQQPRSFVTVMTFPIADDPSVDKSCGHARGPCDPVASKQRKRHQRIVSEYRGDVCISRSNDHPQPEERRFPFVTSRRRRP